MKEKVRQYSKADLDYLINSIKVEYGLNEDQIIERMEYNKGYISQMRSRDEVPAKFIKALKKEFVKSKVEDGISQDSPKTGQEMASTSQLLETINLLVRQNDKLADTNRILAEKISTIPVNAGSGIDEGWDRFRFAAMDFLFEIGAGKRYRSKEEARKIFARILSDGVQTNEKKDIPV